MIRDLQLGCLSCCPCSKAEAGRASKEPNQQVIAVMVKVVMVMVEVIVVMVVMVLVMVW